MLHNMNNERLRHIVY